MEGVEGLDSTQSCCAVGSCHCAARASFVLEAAAGLCVHAGSVLDSLNRVRERI